MRALELRLADEGYATANLGYPSRRLGIVELADRLAPEVQALTERVDGRVHIVTHSMGGLIARVLLARHRPARMGRVVMLAPPNSGSELADRLGRLPPYRWWFGPAGAQLGTRQDAALLGPVDYELGVVAGSRSFYPLASALLPRPNDGRVSVAATRLEEMADHLVLPVTHPTIVWNRTVIAQVVAFLRHGRFDR